LYGLLRVAPKGTPVAEVFEFVFAKVSLMANGSKFPVVFHWLPDTLP
jgi:hypothetical protein